VVPLLGDVVVGAVAAGHAGEGELVVGVLDVRARALGPGCLCVWVAGWFAWSDWRGLGDGVRCADDGQAWEGDVCAPESVG
jgi:hypothetical protein